MTSDKKQPKLPKGWRFLNKIEQCYVVLEYKDYHKDCHIEIFEDGDIIFDTYKFDAFCIPNFSNFARDVTTIGKLYFGKKWGKG